MKSALVLYAVCVVAFALCRVMTAAGAAAVEIEREQEVRTTVMLQKEEEEEEEGKEKVASSPPGKPTPAKTRKKVQIAIGSGAPLSFSKQRVPEVAVVREGQLRHVLASASEPWLQAPRPTRKSLSATAAAAAGGGGDPPLPLPSVSAELPPSSLINHLVPTVTRDGKWIFPSLGVGHSLLPSAKEEWQEAAEQQRLLRRQRQPTWLWSKENARRETPEEERLTNEREGFASLYNSGPGGAVPTFGAAALALYGSADIGVAADATVMDDTRRNRARA